MILNFTETMHLISHLGSSIVLATTIALFLNENNRYKNKYNIITLVGVGGILPDIDAISVLFDHSIFYSNAWYSHHGAMHSVFGIIPLAMTLSILSLYFKVNAGLTHIHKILAFNFAMIYLGCIIHQMEDLPSPEGPWGGLLLFWPISNERFGGWSHFWWQNEYLETLFFVAAVYSLLLYHVYTKYFQIKKIAFYALLAGNVGAIYLGSKFTLTSRYYDHPHWIIYQKKLLGDSIYSAINSFNRAYEMIWTNTIF
jgi:hypothetical protein